MRTSAECEFRLGWMKLGGSYSHYITVPLTELIHYVKKAPVLTSQITRPGFQINTIKRVAGASWVSKTGPGPSSGLQTTSDMLSFPCQRLCKQRLNCWASLANGFVSNVWNVELPLSQSEVTMKFSCIKEDFIKSL